MVAYEFQGHAILPHRGEQTVGRESQRTLEAVWTEVAPELVRLAHSMGVRRDTVDDVIQDVFCKAWKQSEGCSTREHLRRWLIRVTINRCNLYHRRRSRWRRAWIHMARLRTIFSTTPSELSRGATPSRDDLQIVSLVLDELPPHQRSVLVLRYFEEYDSTMIGQILEMPASTVRSHLRKARENLASKLRQVGYEE